MPKARKLKSGNWNVQVFDYRDESGKRHFTSITAPTKAECLYKAAYHQQHAPEKKTEMTVGHAVDTYISLCKALSPCTIQNYKRIRKMAFQDLMNVPIRKLTRETLQRAVNAEMTRERMHGDGCISAKSLKNEYGLISAALREVAGISYSIKLPKIKRAIKQYPEPDEVINLIVGSEVELPCLLAMWCTFSMSEILGLKCSSVRDHCIYIDQVQVYAGKEIIKPVAKATTRNRVHRLPEYLERLIAESDTYKEYLQTGVDTPLITMKRDYIYTKWTTLARKNGLDLTFHDLRHLSASVMLMLNVPEKYAQERGGWATPHVMKSVYQHTFTKERLAVDAIVNNYFENQIKKSERTV